MLPFLCKARTVVPSPSRRAEVRRLADLGDADAQWQLGVLYHDGEGVPKDDTQAVQWFQRAAEQGYVRAQSTLGAYYWAGRGRASGLLKSLFLVSTRACPGRRDQQVETRGLGRPDDSITNCAGAPAGRTLAAQSHSGCELEGA